MGWFVSLLAALSLVMGLAGPTLSSLFGHDHHDDTVAAHVDGSPCPNPCSDGHDCGNGCSCVCCHARLFATRTSEDLSITRAAPAGARASPYPADPDAEGIDRRIFHPPRA